MASSSPKIKSPARIPFWRDVRVLSIIAQAIFMIVVLAGLGWLISNFFVNAERQGLRIGFDFLTTTAGFDIAEGIDYSATDTFGRALWVGTVNTIRISLIGIVLTTLLGIVIGIARLSNNWLLSQVAGLFVEILRNIPLLVLLYFIYFGVVLQLPAVRDSIQPFGWPIFLNQRGVAFPGLVPTTGFPIWLAFIVLGVILVMALWTIQSRQEESTGRPVNKVGNAIFAFLAVVILGWVVTTSFISNQAIMIPRSQNIEAFDDFESNYLAQIDNLALAELGMEQNFLGFLNTAEGVETVKEELNSQIQVAQEAGQEIEVIEALEAQLQLLNEAQLVVCGISDSVGAINAASQLRRLGIEVRVRGADLISKASNNYAGGDCHLLAGSQVELATERVILENPTAHVVLPVSVPPLIINTPAPAGFNIQGGSKISPEFAALLFGLVIYTGAFAAEIVRAGILSVSKGQTEAARALGLTETQRLRLIVLPQAMRVIIPPMTSQYLNLTKNSSLAVAIAYPDLVSVGNTVMNQSGLAVQIIIIFMVTYLTISLTISAFLNWYNQKVALVER